MFMFIGQGRGGLFRQPQTESTAGQFSFITSRTFHPSLTSVRPRNSAHDSQAQARSATFESGSARRMDGGMPRLIELLENQFVMFGVQADACIANRDQDALRLILRLSRARGYGHFATIGCVLDGIDGEMIQRFVNQRRVAVDEGRIRFGDVDQFDGPFGGGF